MKAKTKTNDILRNEWKKSRLCELAKYINGRAFKPEEWDTEGTPIIRIENLNNNLAPFNYYKGECEDKYIVKNGDLLVSWSASLDTFIWQRDQAYLNQHIFKVVPFDDKINKQFLYFLLMYSMSKLKEEIHGATMQHITKPKFDNFEVFHPEDIKKQINIADNLNTQIEAVLKMQEAALKQKEAISALQGAILRDIYPAKIGSGLPKGWKWSPLSQICKINPRKPSSLTQPDNTETSFVPMESIDEAKGSIVVKKTRPFKEVVKGYTYFENGDVLFAKITPCMQNGKSTIVNDLINGFGFGSTEFHVLRAKEGVSNEWIYYFLRTAEFRKRAEDHFTGSAGQQRVPVDFIKDSLIPIPDKFAEQTNNIKIISLKMNEINQMMYETNTLLEAVNALSASFLRKEFDFAKEN